MLPMRAFELAIVVLAVCLRATAASEQSLPPSVALQLKEAVNSSPLSDVSVHIGVYGIELFSHSKGEQAPERDETIAVASASKWVSAILIMQLVEDGFMGLGSKPQDFLDFWSTEGRKSRVTLHSLLSFTSGFQGSFSDSPCLMDNNASVTDCTRLIHDRLGDLDFEPGTTFGYSNENLEIAAAMAEAATGLSWSSIYDRYLKTPLGISPSSFYAGNKGAAGNLQISAADYIRILSAVMLGGNGTNDAPMSLQSLLEMNTDRTAEPEVQININKTFSALLDLPDWPSWHYGYGHWIECPSSSPLWSPSCTRNAPQGVHSSMGAAGFYPVVDFRERQGDTANAGGLYIVVSPPLSLLFSSQDSSLPEDAPMNLARLLGSDLLQIFDQESPPVSYDDEAEGGSEAEQPGAGDDEDGADDESSPRRPIVLCGCWATKSAYFYCCFGVILLLLCSCC